MKSKSYILSQVRKLLLDNRGYYEDEADRYIEDIKNKTVYELLVIKKDLSENKEYPDVSCMRWYREEDR
jgi:hypothetical protein